MTRPTHVVIVLDRVSAIRLTRTARRGVRTDNDAEIVEELDCQIDAQLDTRTEP